MRKYAFVTMLVVALALTLTACATTGNVPAAPDTGSGSGNSEVKEVRIEAYSFGFDVSGPQINKGDHVKLTVSSRDGTHGLAIPGLNVNSGPLAAGEEKVIEFTATDSGAFDYFCNVPCGEGHRSMKGTLTVN